jgi:hypothetical protein
MDYPYDSNISVNSVIVPNSQRKDHKHFPFLCLCVFALLRPILTIEYFAESSIFGVNYLEIFSVWVSYLLILATLIQIYKSRKFQFDLVTIVGISFCFFIILTIFTGSYINKALRIVLPFVVFISARTILDNKNQILTILVLIIISYIWPVIGSTWSIVNGESIGKTIYYTGLARYDGLYLKINTLAHSMLIFIFIFLLYLTLSKKTSRGRKLFIIFLFFLSTLALFNLYKSYTRNVFIGLFILLNFYFAGRKNYIIIFILFLGAITIAITSSTFQTIFFDFIEPLTGQRDLSDLGSGRYGMWTHYLKNFSKFSLEVKLMGTGIGLDKLGFGIARGHNDFLSILITTGLIGLFLYFSLLAIIFCDILRSYLDRELKFLFLGFLIAVCFMNLASNSYVTRIELGQFFFLIFGAFYVLNDLKRKRV